MIPIPILKINIIKPVLCIYLIVLFSLISLLLFLLPLITLLMSVAKVGRSINIAILISSLFRPFAIKIKESKRGLGINYIGF